VLGNPAQASRDGGGRGVSGGGHGLSSSSVMAADGLPSDDSAGLSCFFPYGRTSKGPWMGKAGLCGGELGLCSPAPCTKHKPAFQCRPPDSPPLPPNLAELL